MAALNNIIVREYPGDPARVVEVVIPYYQGTVAEAVAAARAVIADLTIDDVAGLGEAVAQGDSATLSRARQASIVSSLIFG